MGAEFAYGTGFGENEGMGTVEVNIGLQGREELSLVLELNESKEIIASNLRVIGPPQFLDLARRLRSSLKGKLSEVPLPVDKTAGALLIREALLRARGEWNPPYVEEELCHCRGVLTAKVDQAIVLGAHTPRKVSELTSASTACGTCRPDVEALIAYRLGRG